MRLSSALSHACISLINWSFNACLCFSFLFSTTKFSYGSNKVFPNSSKRVQQVPYRCFCPSWYLVWVPFETLYKLILACIFISILLLAMSLCALRKKEGQEGAGRNETFSGSAHFSVPFLCCLDFQDLVLTFSVNLTTEISFSVERRRAREEQAVAVNKMFYQESSTAGNQQAVHYSVTAQVRKVCEVVDGFIYVANAEAHRGKGFLFIYILWITGVLEYKEYAIHQNPCSDPFKICYFFMVYPVEEVSYPRSSLSSTC